MKSVLKLLPLVALPTLSMAVDTETHTSFFEELVITSSRIEQPLREVATSITALDRDELELLGYHSMADLLRTQMSVGVSNSGGRGQQTTLRIRGEEGYRTKLLIDGVDMSDPSATQVSPLFQNILSSYDIERVEILRGPQGFLYGADAGGVVNIITGNIAEGQSAGLSVEGGTNQTQNLAANLSLGSQNAGLSLAVTDTSTDGFNARSDDTDLVDDDGSSNTTLHLKGNWTLTDQLSLTAVYRDVDMDYDYDNCFSATPNDCQGHNQQENTKLSLDYQLDKISHQLSYALTDVSRETFSGGAFVNLYEGETSRATYLGSYDFAESQSVVFGVDREQQQYKSSYGDQWKRHQTGIFTEYQQAFNGSLFITAGLRRDDNSDFGTHTSYRLSGAYVQDLANGNSLKYRVVYGTGFRAPSLYEVSSNFGPYAYGDAADFVPDLEQSKGMDLGVDYLFANGALLQLTYFDQQIENEIYYDMVGYSGYLQDQGKSYSEGVEAAFSYGINDNLDFSINYTYNSTESDSGETRVRRPKHQGNISLSSSALRGKLNTMLNLRFSHDAVDVGQQSLADYQLVDISLNYQLRDHIDVFGRLENLLDTDYVEVIGFNSPGRSVYGGIRYRF